ncbi:MAG: PIN domain-containing protein [Pseudomonadota bacterium]
MTARVFLDACVLFPPLVRSLILAVAEQGAFQPFWSDRVLDEWRLAVARQHGVEGEAGSLAAQAQMARDFLDAAVAPVEEVPAKEAPDIHLPDPADLHVVGAALAAQADTILTFNMRDFPARTLAPLGLQPRHPDSFLWEHLSHAPERLSPVISDTLTGFGIDPAAARAPLKRAHLGRFAKAWHEKAQ